jgi:hypothetical protein
MTALPFSRVYKSCTRFHTVISVVQPSFCRSSEDAFRRVWPPALKGSYLSVIDMWRSFATSLFTAAVKSSGELYSGCER